MRTPFLIIPCALLLFVSAGCSGDDGAASAATANGRGGRGGAGGAGIPVAVGTVIKKAMPIEITVIGAAEPLTSVAIRAQTTGQLTSVNFTEGDEVTAGQTLFTLDRRPLEAALLQAQANLDRDMAQAANAVQQAKRYDDLAQRGIATREQVDTSRTAVTALNATVDADKAAVENAKVQLEYATILAPITGRTGVLMVHEGNLVRANDQTALVVINQVRTDLGLVRHSGSASARAEEVHGRRRAARHGECAERRRVTGGRSHHLRRQLRRSDDGRRSRLRARSPMPIAGCGPASTSMLWSR